LAKRGEVVLFVEGAGRGAVVMGEVGGGAVANQPKWRSQSSLENWNFPPLRRHPAQTRTRLCSRLGFNWRELSWIRVHVLLACYPVNLCQLPPVTTRVLTAPIELLPQQDTSMKIDREERAFCLQTRHDFCLTLDSKLRTE